MNATTLVAPQRYSRSVLFVGFGLVVLAAANLVYLASAARSLGPAMFSSFSSYWSLLSGVGIGLALPLENDEAERVVHGRAAGQGVAAAVVTAILTLCGVGMAVAGLFGPDLAPIVALSGAAMAASYLVRGLFAGKGWFTSYAFLLGAEGIAKLAIVAALVTAGVGTTTPFAVGVAVATAAALVASAVTVRGERATVLRTLAWSRRSPHQPPILPLVVSSVVSQSLINLGPVILMALTPDRVVAGVYLATALTARAPTMAFSSVQATLVPRFARALRADSSRDLVSAVSVGLGLALVVGTAGAIAMGFAATPLVHIVAGRSFTPDRSVATWLAVATAAFMVCLVLQALNQVLGARWGAAGAWLVGAVVFLVCSSLPGVPVDVVTRALVLGIVATFVALSLSGARALRVKWGREQRAGDPSCA